jgi:hypothetical protein
VVPGQFFAGQFFAEQFFVGHFSVGQFLFYFYFFQVKRTVIRPDNSSLENFSHRKFFDWTIFAGQFFAEFFFNQSGLLFDRTILRPDNSTF